MSRRYNVQSNESLQDEKRVKFSSMKKLILILISICVVIGLVVFVSIRFKPVDMTSRVWDKPSDELDTILITPDEYLNKTVVLKGVYENNAFEGSPSIRHMCVVKNEDDDYQTFIEFVLKDGQAYPSEEGREITIKGKFEAYDNDCGGSFYRLVNAEIVE